MPTAATRIAHLGHVLPTAPAKRMGAAMVRRMERVVEMRMAGVRRSGAVRHSRCVNRDFYTQMYVWIHETRRVYTERCVNARNEMCIYGKMREHTKKTCKKDDREIISERISAVSFATFFPYKHVFLISFYICLFVSVRHFNTRLFVNVRLFTCTYGFFDMVTYRSALGVS